MAVGKKTGGRQKGSRNRRTVAVEEQIREAAQVIEQALPDAFKGDAHALLMAVYKDVTHPLPVRIDAAKAAISFERPKLAAVTHAGDADNPIHTRTRIEQVVVDGSGEGESDPGLRAKETRTAH